MAGQASSNALSVTRLATLIVLLAIAAVFFGDHYFGGKGMLVPHAASTATDSLVRRTVGRIRGAGLGPAFLHAVLRGDPP